MRDERLSLGLCAYCGKNEVEKGRQCDDCRAYMREYQKKSHEKKIRKAFDSMKTEPPMIGRERKGSKGATHYYPHPMETHRKGFKTSLCGLARFGEELPGVEVNCVPCQRKAHKLAVYWSQDPK